MKIKILDNVFEKFNVDTTKEHDVIRTVVDDDDLFYIIHDKNGEEFGVIDMCADEIK